MYKKLLTSSLWLITLIQLPLYSISTFDRINEIGSEQELQQLIINPNPLVVVFFAQWCGVCNQIKTPLEHTVNKGLFSSIRFVCIDSDKFRDLADKYGVKGVPTFLFFKNRALLHRDIGIEHMDKFQENLEVTIKKVFASNPTNLHNLIDSEVDIKNSASQGERTTPTTNSQAQGFITSTISGIVHYIKAILWYAIDKITDLIQSIINLIIKWF